MNYDSWSVDLVAKTATHISGVKIHVEGDPSSPSGINPSGFSKSMSALDQARLLRCGFKAFQQEASKQKA